MIGIDISDSSVKVVRLNNARRRFLAATWSAIPPNIITGGIVSDAAAVTAIIQKLLHSWHLKNEVTVASVSGADSFLRVVKIPTMPEKDVGEAVIWEASHHLPFDVESIYADWQPVRGLSERTGADSEVLVGAAEKKKIDALCTVLSTLGLDVAALELESVALVRALISPNDTQTRGLLIVDIGETNTNVVVYDCGTLRFTSSLPHGLKNLAPDKTAPAPQDHLTSLATAVSGIVDYYNNLFPDHSITEILLTGGGSLLAGLDQAFLTKFDNIHIQRGNPWVNILPAKHLSSPPLPVEESAHYATAIGLALRPV